MHGGRAAVQRRKLAYLAPHTCGNSGRPPCKCDVLTMAMCQQLIVRQGDCSKGSPSSRCSVA